MASDSQEERFDGIFLNVAQQVGSIENIMDNFFGFLLRKTDFFTAASSEDAAAAIVMKSFAHHWKEGLKKRDELQERNAAADRERREREETRKEKDRKEFEARRAEQARQAAEAAERPICEEVTDEEAAKIEAENKARAGTRKDGENDEGAKSDGEDSKEPPPCGNGGTTEKYTWTQTLSALEVYVPVQPGVKARQIVCDIGMDHLKCGVKGDALTLNGKFHSRVKPDECTWTLVDNKTVQITLEKHDGMKWWSCVLQGDPSIDTKKVVPENSKLSDLDGETRMTVEKMMYDQRQKTLGLPTSDQEKQHELLEKFKAAHPEMDFSKAKINYGGGGGGGGGFSFGQ